MYPKAHFAQKLIHTFSSPPESFDKNKQAWIFFTQKDLGLRNLNLKHLVEIISI